MKLDDNGRHVLNALLIPSVAISFFAVSSFVIAMYTNWAEKESILNAIFFAALAIVVLSMLLFHVLAGVKVIIENEKTNAKKKAWKISFFIIAETIACGLSFLVFGFTAIGSVVACGASRFLLNCFG